MSLLRKYGAATTVLFPLVDRGAVDFESTPVTFAAADTQISKDEGAFANTGSTPAHEGNGFYSLALTATEMQAARIMISCIDSATKTWEDQAVLIDTYGNASAQHAFDLDTADQAVDVVNWRGSQPDALTSGLVNADVERWRGSVPTTLTSGKVASDLRFWLSATPNALASGRVDASVGAMAADVLTDAAVATDLDTYQAKVWIIDDDSGGNDRYMFSFFKNGKQITSGVTVPTVYVYSAAASPVDLVGTSGSPQSLTEAGSTETWFHNGSTNRIASGTAYFARCRFTVDGSEREWTQPIGRDSTA